MTNVTASAADERVEQLADLADLLVNVSREVRDHGPAREPRDGRVVLTQRESRLMRCIDRHPGVTPSDASVITDMLPTNLSATLRTLRDKHLVEVRRDEHDHRVIHLHPTPTSATNLTVVRGIWIELLGSVLSADDPDLPAGIALLNRLEAGLVAARVSTGAPSPERDEIERATAGEQTSPAT